jgi:hypothetical protein
MSRLVNVIEQHRNRILGHLWEKGFPNLWLAVGRPVGWQPISEEWFLALRSAMVPNIGMGSGTPAHQAPVPYHLRLECLSGLQTLL